jgi:hypothetical protein
MPVKSYREGGGCGEGFTISGKIEKGTINKDNLKK